MAMCCSSIFAPQASKAHFRIAFVHSLFDGLCHQRQRRFRVRGDVEVKRLVALKLLVVALGQPVARRDARELLLLVKGLDEYSN